MSSSEFIVGVFAHNEAEKILLCLESIRACMTLMKLHCYVLANGCTDRTCAIVREYMKDHDFVSLVEIEFPDKANAWNVFVHEVSTQQGIHIFVDGDVEVMPNALFELAHGLASSPAANAAAAVPDDCGMSSKWMRDYLV